MPHAHQRAGGPRDETLAPTPIWLVDDAAPAPPASVLLNLGPNAVDELDGYQRVIELVGTGDADRQTGRQRWRHYQSQGRTLTHITPVAA